MDHIIIPTLGRINKQITYNSLSDEFKKKVVFVVQHHEYEDFKKVWNNHDVRQLPPEIKTLAPTREWIYHQFKNTRHFVFDDDLEFIVKELNEGGDTKWKTRSFTDQDFTDAFALVDSWIDEGYDFGGFLPTWVIPDPSQYPIRENHRVMTNVFYNGPNIPEGLEWDRVPAAEDLDMMLQLLTRGIQNRVSSKYMVACSETNAEGGCSVYRTLDFHNDSQRKLAQLWPDYVSIREKEVKGGVWKGQKKLSVKIFAKKAYQSSQKPDTQSLEDFFG